MLVRRESRPRSVLTAMLSPDLSAKATKAPRHNLRRIQRARHRPCSLEGAGHACFPFSFPEGNGAHPISGFTRDRAYLMRKSGQPDLRWRQGGGAKPPLGGLARPACASGETREPFVQGPCASRRSTADKLAQVSRSFDRSGAIVGRRALPPPSCATRDDARGQARHRNDKAGLEDGDYFFGPSGRPCKTRLFMPAVLFSFFAQSVTCFIDCSACRSSHPTRTPR
jgi:hypothetical protein